MGKPGIPLAAAALLLGSVAWTAPGANPMPSSWNAQAQNSTVVYEAACGGFVRLLPARIASWFERPKPLLVRSRVNMNAAAV